jgi:hypothetical protein
MSFGDHVVFDSSPEVSPTQLNAEAEKLWDLLVLWLIVYSCVVVPFRIGMR